MAVVTIEGHLTEQKLTEALQQLVGDAWLGGQLKLAGDRRRWDAAFRRVDVVVLAEFDGPDHYCHSLKIKADRAKDEAARQLPATLVRVPYWVQLDSVTLAHYFGLTAEVRCDFPHGFVTTKHFPASFCELGVARFERELSELPAGVQAEVVRSLEERAREHGLEYVLPSRLRYLLDG
jgi:hypothetical protein